MSNSAMNLVKGMAWGAAFGVATAVAGTKLMETNKKSMKKKANKALKSMENVLDTASYMFK